MDLIPPAEGAQTLFMGHGTHRSADLVYPALQGIFHLAGRDDLVVATVEGLSLIHISQRAWRSPPFLQNS